MAEARLRRGLAAGLGAMLVAASAFASDQATISPVNYSGWDVDLSGEGVVAISRSHDGVHALMLYCRMDDGIARVRIEGLGDGLNETLRVISEAGGIDAFGRIVDKSEVSATELGGIPGIDIRVEAFHPDFVLDEDELFVGDESGARPKTDAYPAIHVPIDNAAAAFAVALRNCV